MHNIMLRSNRLLWFLIFILMVSIGYNDTGSRTGILTGTWQNSTPESQGIDSRQLAKIFDYIKENEINIHSTVLIRNGYLIMDAYFYPNSKGILHDVASVTKSITSVLIGIAIDKGYIKSIDQAVLDFFPDRKIENMDNRKRQLTIEHLLTMRTGFCLDFMDGERQLDNMRRTKDWVQYMLDQPLLTNPGEEFAYCTGGTHLLSAIITKATGMNELQFAEKYLFGPLDIHDVIWPADPVGNNTGGFDLHMHAYDLAKIGYLLLNEGIWQEKQIVSKEWIEQSTHFTSLGDDLYAYLWWAPDENPDLVEGRGRGGQRLIYSKKRNIVLVFTGSGFDPGEIGELLLPAIRSDQPLPENFSAYKLLQEKTDSAASIPDPTPINTLPPIAQKISYKTYEFEPNSKGWISFSLEFGNRNEAIFKLTEDNHYEENRIGLDNLYRISSNSAFGLPEALKGQWISDNEFEILYNEFANNHLYHLTFSFPFGKDIAKLHVIEATGLLNITLIAKLLD
jgi:CubicO group peptidase (beta-lactamase class C family)